jgi:hypothetical protein
LAGDVGRELDALDVVVGQLQWWTKVVVLVFSVEKRGLNAMNRAFEKPPNASK